MYIEINIKGFVCGDPLSIIFYMDCNLLNNNTEFLTCVRTDDSISCIKDIVDVDYEHYVAADHI